MYSQLKAYSEKQLSSTPIITVRDGVITEAGEGLAIFLQVFQFPVMPSFLSQSLSSHAVLSRCACDDILNLLSLNSPSWANQLVTSSHKQHSSLFIHNCLCWRFLFGGIILRISSQGDIFPSEFIGNRIFGYNGIYTSRVEAVTRTVVFHYLFPRYDLINLLWFWFRFYCNCINALYQALKGAEIVLFILMGRKI